MTSVRFVHDGLVFRMRGVTRILWAGQQTGYFFGLTIVAAAAAAIAASIWSGDGVGVRPDKF